MKSMRMGKFLGRFGAFSDKGSALAVGSYVLVLLLPGGSLIALLMYAYQTKRAAS